MAMRSLRLTPAVAFALVSLIAPQTTVARDKPKLERGSFSRDATGVCSLAKSASPFRIPSPDGMKVIAVRPDEDADSPHSIVTVEAFGKKVQVGFTWSPDCEIAWSPDSRAFFVTYTMGGAVGGFVMQVFSVTPLGPKLVDDPTESLVNDFMSRPHYCFWNEGPNVAGVTWLTGSTRLLVAAEFLPHSNCEEMGTFRAYEITILDGKIVESYDQLLAKKLFWSHLGVELRNADDTCAHKPKYCEAEAVKLGRKRFTN